MAPSESNFSVQRNRGAQVKTRRVYVLSGVAPPVEYRVHNNNIVNLERAILERVFNVSTNGGFSPPPKPESKEYFEAKMSTFKQKLRKTLPVTTPISPEQFAGLYTGRRRRIYEEAVASLYMEGVKRKDSYISAFVKAEKINFTAKPDPAPRVIQPRTPRYNVEVGKFLKPLEKRVYRGVAKVFGSTTVMKGLNARERGRAISRKWARFRNPVAVGLDASRFDQHVSRVALEWEHSIYHGCFRGHDLKEITKLLEWQIDNRGYGRCEDGTLKYRTDGCRMSGDMNTALGNCLLMCAMVWSFMNDMTVDDFELVNDGDDCVLFFERERLDEIMVGVKPWFLGMGFSMKVEEPVFEIEHIEFCQSRPVFDGNDYLMVRDIRTALAKDCVSIKPFDRERDLLRYCGSIGEGGLNLTGGIPVWQDFYRMLVESSCGYKLVAGDALLESGMFRLADRMNRLYTPPTAETMISFEKAFGISPDMQNAMSDFFRTDKVRWHGQSHDPPSFPDFWA